ncbi:MAG: cell wall-binding repeat-containing protein [Coriobacteriia bacterium]
MHAFGPGRRCWRLLSISLALALLTFGVPAPASAEITGIVGGNLTTDAFDQSNPSIWRGIAAWKDGRADPDGDIYGYDWYADTPLVICTDPAIQTFPVVGDEYVVWQDYRNGNSDIYAWNMVEDTEVPICTNGSGQAVPDIYERYIVWHDIRNGNWDIYGYDLVDDVEFPICTDAGSQTMAAIWGDVVVWQDSRSGVSNIWTHDISTGITRPVSTSATGQYDPEICQERIVWYEEIAPGDDAIRQYNLSSGETGTAFDRVGDQMQPHLDGDWLLYLDQAVDSGDTGLVDLLQGSWESVFPTTGIAREAKMAQGLAVYQFDNGSDPEIMIAEPQWTHDTQSLAGGNRYETAGRIANEAWRHGGTDVVIATGENFPDALGAAALAGSMNVPLVLTDGDHLSADAAAALADLGTADDILVVGGEAAISPAVIDELEVAVPTFDSPIQRLSGTDRYGTAAAVANAVADLGGIAEPYGFVCTGLNYPDALAASSMAYALGIPVYLVNGTSIPQSLIDQMVSNGVTIPVIVGGESVVSGAIESDLAAEFGVDNVWRVWGSNRYETSYELASFAQFGLDFGASGACVATGESFPDALAGGQLAGNRYAPLLLTDGDTLSAATATWLSENAEEVRGITILGGTGAISTGVRNHIDTLLY